MATIEEIAYSAGLFDGEGCAYWTKDQETQTYFGMVAITQVERGVLDWLAATWGMGRVYESNTENAPRPTRTGTIFNWRLGGNQAKEFLQAIYPFLRIKHIRAAAWLEMHAAQLGRNARRDPTTGRMTGYTVQERAILDAMYRQYGELPGGRPRLVRQVIPIGAS